MTALGQAWNCRTGMEPTCEADGAPSTLADKSHEGGGRPPQLSDRHPPHGFFSSCGVEYSFVVNEQMASASSDVPSSFSRTSIQESTDAPQSDAGADGPRPRALDSYRARDYRYGAPRTQGWPRRSRVDQTWRDPRHAMAARVCGVRGTWGHRIHVAALRLFRDFGNRISDPWGLVRYRSSIKVATN